MWAKWVEEEKREDETTKQWESDENKIKEEKA